MNKVRIWDLPTRVFHWGLVLCLVGLIGTGKIGGEAMVWHFRLGYTVLSLLLFRLVWGFMGGFWSRFHVFVVGPMAIWRYLQGRHSSPAVGHNPLGALSVLAMLGFILIQVSTGLAAMAFYYFKRKENLVPAMLLGDKMLSEPHTSARDDGKSRLTALVVFAVCAGLVTGLVQWAG